MFWYDFLYTEYHPEHTIALHSARFNCEFFIRQTQIWISYIFPPLGFLRSSFPVFYDLYLKSCRRIIHADGKMTIFIHNYLLLIPAFQCKTAFFPLQIPQLTDKPPKGFFFVRLDDICILLLQVSHFLQCIISFFRKIPANGAVFCNKKQISYRFCKLTFSFSFVTSLFALLYNVIQIPT